MKVERVRDNRSERGLALVSALLATTMVLALGMAIVFSATSDTITTKTARVSEQAFFAADAGVGVARRAIAQALEDKLNELKANINSGATAPYNFVAASDVYHFPTVQLVPDPDTTDGQASPFYQGVLSRAATLADYAARNQALNDLNGSSFSITFNALSGNVSLTPGTPSQATQVFVFRYSLKVTGQAAGGGTATVNECGRLSASVDLTMPPPDAARNFSFSGFAAFFDNGDTQANAPLASGTFTGPVHTNTHFAFDSSRQVNFGNIVSQYDDMIRYDNTSNTTPNHARPTTDIQGININDTEGYKKTDSKVPLPANNFSQEYAVINATGITDIDSSTGLPVDPPSGMPGDNKVFDSAGRVLPNVLSINLRDANNNKANVNSGQLVSGVYVSSSDGSNITGAGIYVKGDASDIQIYADTNGDQVYVIKQGLTTTTVRCTYGDSPKTTITTGTKSKQFNGAFQDRGDKSNPRPGTILFVDGSISSLRGGKDLSGTKPAVSANTRLTITAQQDITVTGDLIYASAVVDKNGTPVAGIDSVNNVLGIFTNDGNVNLVPNATYVKSGLSLEMDAAVVAFNSNTSNDGGLIEGSIVYTGATLPGTGDTWTLVGSRVQSKINSIGYGTRNIYFDKRFAGGTFAPPFFPGTNYQFSPVPATSGLQMTTITTPFAAAMSWFRDHN
jgi:hypothetical protein